MRLISLPWPVWVASTTADGVITEISESIELFRAPSVKLQDLLTPGSKLLMEGVLLPELLATDLIEDILLKLRGEHGADIPVVCHARRDAETGFVHWAFLPAWRREEAERQLVELRREQEARAEALEREVGRDPLTGIPNRRAFFDRFRNSGPPINGACLLIDIDHFKRINDTFGHLVGDAVIKGVARIIANAVRDTDVFARFGGEEFIVWCTNVATPAEAFEIAERIRIAIADFESKNCELRVTASIGVCLARPSDSASLFDIIERADQALYAAKKDGRNKTRIATTGLS